MTEPAARRAAAALTWRAPTRVHRRAGHAGDGRLQVTDTISYDFGGNRRYGPLACLPRCTLWVLARGKRSYDKRQNLAKRDAQREIARAAGRRR